MTTETSIYEYAKQGLALSENKTAIWFYGKSITYRELFEKIDNVADNLYALGVREGTVVTIHLPNCPQAVMAIYAVAKLGGICNMVHALMPRDGLKENMAFTESDFLVTYKSDCAAKTTVLVDISRHMGIKYKIGYRLKNGKVKGEGISFDELEKKAETKGVFPEQSSLAEKCSVYLNSSGTTGKEKIVVHNHISINNFISNTTPYFPCNYQKQVYLGILPLFHSFGFLDSMHCGLCWGCETVLMARWNSKDAAREIKLRNVTIITGVPKIFVDLLQEKNFNGSNLTFCIVGGEHCDNKIKKEFNRKVEKSHCIYECYGLSEAMGAICSSHEEQDDLFSSGFPIPNCFMSVMREDGAICDYGIGELLVSSNTLMKGYLKDDEATKGVVIERNEKKWIRTGDYAEIKENQSLVILGRIKDIIIRNGYNIFPLELEKRINSLLSVYDSCVFGVTEGCLEKIIAYIIPQNGYDKKQIINDINNMLVLQCPKYAWPTQYCFCESFPRTNTGKIDRNRLKNFYERKNKSI